MSERNYNVIQLSKADGDPIDTVPVKMWNKHVAIEKQAQQQLLEVASMPFVKPYVAAMPDTHWGMGATVGSVIPTQGAVMPAAVGVDIGCGMIAVRTTLRNGDLDPLRKENLKLFFDEISKAVPHGRTDNGGENDRGAWGRVPDDIHEIWSKEFQPFIDGAVVLPDVPRILGTAFVEHPGALSRNGEKQLGTLGTGNHFIEVSTEIDNPNSQIYIVIHSGSRGFGNRIGTYFTRLAGRIAEQYHIKLPNRDLGYLPKDTPEYNSYIELVELAQKFAWRNREIMMSRVLNALGTAEDASNYVSERWVPTSHLLHIPSRIHMHHNYMAQERHFGQDVLLTRKGAVDASEGKWVIIPGSMGAKTYIALGKGDRDSFHSCSHGAGRAMSRGEAIRTFTVQDHAAATEGVMCDKTTGTLDETPGAYKDIDAVMESQKDLVEPILKIKQLVSVKGISD